MKYRKQMGRDIKMLRRFRPSHSISNVKMSTRTSRDFILIYYSSPALGLYEEYVSTCGSLKKRNERK